MKKFFCQFFFFFFKRWMLFLGERMSYSGSGRRRWVRCAESWASLAPQAPVNQCCPWGQAGGAQQAAESGEASSSWDWLWYLSACLLPWVVSVRAHVGSLLMWLQPFSFSMSSLSASRWTSQFPFLLPPPFISRNLLAGCLVWPRWKIMFYLGGFNIPGARGLSPLAAPEGPRLQEIRTQETRHWSHKKQKTFMSDNAVSLSHRYPGIRLRCSCDAPAWNQGHRLARNSGWRRKA